MFIEISCGEALDRLSILEIKISEIQDMKKRIEIQKEIDSLSEILPTKQVLLYYYNLLLRVNKKIWDLTNEIKATTKSDARFGDLAHTIFELNQSRFRVKSVLNRISSSRIQEQKSYGLTEVYIRVEPEHTDTILDTLSELSLRYDIVNVDCDESMQTIILKSVPEFNYRFNQV